MCGIAVHLSLDGPAQPLDLQLMRHRGPDSSGEWTSSHGRCWLGNTRLAIVDLSPTVKLLILSDTPTNNDVPEPSTGLLLGAALPALLGMRRFLKRPAA